MKTPVAIIGESGGMGNAYGNAYLLASGIRPEQFSAGFGVSSGAMKLLFFFAGLVEESLSTWEKFTSPDVFHLMNPIRKGTRPADIDSVVEIANRLGDIGSRLPVDKDLWAETVEVESGLPSYFRMTKDNWQQVIKASCSLPLLARPVEIDGRKYVDGAAYDQLPVQKAYEMGYRKMLIIGNKPSDFQPTQFSTLSNYLFFPNSPAARQMMKGRLDRYEASKEFVRRPPAGVDIFHVQPQILPCTLLERSVDNVRRAIDLGLEQGRRESQQVHDWLAN